MKKPPKAKAKQRKFKPDAPCKCGHPWSEHMESWPSGHTCDNAKCRGYCGLDVPPNAVLSGCIGSGFGHCPCDKFERHYYRPRKPVALKPPASCFRCGCPAWTHQERLVSVGFYCGPSGCDTHVAIALERCLLHPLCGIVTPPTEPPEGPPRRPPARSKGKPRAPRKPVDLVLDKLVA